jgi:restriction system protein
MTFGSGPIGSNSFGSSSRIDVVVNLGTGEILRSSPTIVIKAILDFGGRTEDGRLVSAVAVPWFDIVRMLLKDPASMPQIRWDKWEEIIAGAYKREGFDEVILTPRSGDYGRDVIATKWGRGSIRFYDQMKVYSPGHLVKAEEARAMAGVIGGALNVSKGIVTTDFAPRLREDPFIKPFLPHRLELTSGDGLLALARRWPAVVAPK